MKAIRPRPRAFTLVELLVVMTIIGILMAFILKALSGGVRAAEEKATIALIAKLEQAMTDRVDAITASQAEPSIAHYRLSASYNGSNAPIENTQRAQAIAKFDYIRAQLPDVFMPQSNVYYPLNFAGANYGPGVDDADFQLPMGNTVVLANGGSWDGNLAHYSPGTGIYGASYEIAAGIYKQLGYGPKGIDGSDNNNNGLVDEIDESILGLTPAEQTTTSALIAKRLSNHTHKTARSEMLYAILVEGGGVYGSSFDKDDFTSKEVQDTDGDGLMEFVDAWGEPLQYYRWPILYRSDAQKGFPDVAKLTLDLAAVPVRKPGPYAGVYESREQNPLDPNQTLMAPAWWGNWFNNTNPGWQVASSGGISATAMTFMKHFGPCLVDPAVISAPSPGPSSASYWDRSTLAVTPATGPIYPRRAYYSRFLILSGGPDKSPGTAQLRVDYKGSDDRTSIEIPGGTATGRDGSGVAVDLSVANLLIESQGGKVDLNRASNGLGTLLTFPANGRNDTNSQLEAYSQDDITSQTYQGIGGPLQ